MKRLRETNKTDICISHEGGVQGEEYGDGAGSGHLAWDWAAWGQGG